MSADPGMGRVMRMVAMRVASCAGFTVDRVDDVAMATSEAFTVVSSGGATRADIELSTDPAGGLAVALTSDGSVSTGTDPAIDPLTDRVLRSVTDDVSYGQDPLTVRFRIDHRE
jgi:hypothetical protein